MLVPLEPQLVVLPEIWNSPYATGAFPEYAEVLPKVGANSCEGSPSSALLMERAKQHKMWIVGGSIPEIEDDKRKGGILSLTVLIVIKEKKEKRETIHKSNFCP